jgi:nucleotide-binding universal stress UspA family protein
MKKLIVPVDFSEESVIAIDYAIELANAGGFGIRMVHVIKKKSYYFGFANTSAVETPIEVIEDNFKKLTESHSPRLANGILFEWIIKHGNIAEEILAESAANDVYAIVTGLLGNTSMMDYLVGSNAYRILAGAHKPVFTTRKGMTTEKIKRILMPIDDTTGTRIKVPIVSALAAYLNVPVVILAVSDTHITEINERIEMYAIQSEEFLNSAGVKVTLIHEYGVDIPQAILNAIGNEDASLLAFMSDISDDPLGMILSSNVKHLLQKSSVPLLCVPMYI